ncbi:MAG: HEPN domain-containing protein [Candidatus Margulisiibacteriota bacterium]|jgi:HEPN domain-containing protein
MIKESYLNPKEWLMYAKADLESAEVILNSTKNYHISAYHSHQAITSVRSSKK